VLAVNQVSVVLADHRMPGMTGVELLRRVKALYPDTVRLVMSGDADAQAVTEAINQGAVYKFIVKPWDHHQLQSNLRQAFAHKALQDENRHLSSLMRQLQVV
jgi:DNA-binding NtrC family response regulator